MTALAGPRHSPDPLLPRAIRLACFSDANRLILVAVENSASGIQEKEWFALRDQADVSLFA